MVKTNINTNLDRTQIGKPTFGVLGLLWSLSIAELVQARFF